MSSKNDPSPLSDDDARRRDAIATMPTMPHPATPPPLHTRENTAPSASFWPNRLFEASLILSMGLYYIVGNPDLSLGALSRLNPLFSLPFLVIFAVLCWFRLSFAIALLPLSLPYYLLQKVVVSHYRFSLVEVVLFVCVVVALLQMSFKRKSRLAWSDLRDRWGPFLFPVLVFFVAAAISVVIAYDRVTAARAFRQEVFDPLLYVVLAFVYLRSRQDLTRLIGGLFGAGLTIALLGMVQYFLFKNTLVLEDGVRRVHTVYGSANSIGLLFDYTLPPFLALVMARASWKKRCLALVLCMPPVLTLYLTQSLGAWVAIALAALFIVMCSIRSRKVLLIGSCVEVVALVIVLALFHRSILTRISDWHANPQGYSTTTKRLYLWETALHMIHDRPLLGFGMDNWLCYYSKNTLCNGHGKLPHYWILKDPVTHAPTGLSEEPTLSHPHNIFLQIWVSMGIFGLLSFVAVLILFYWLFARILARLRSPAVENAEQLRWMTVGVGASMLAALVQGMVDSSFLEQDLAFCFWTLILALLLLRAFAHVSWRPGKYHASQSW